jgi:DNA-binding NarL/FixJ family response regulator
VIGGLIRVLIWAKSAVARAGLEAIVGGDPRFQVVADQARSLGLTDAIRASEPDIVLLDLPDGSRPPAFSFTGLRPAAPVAVALFESARRAEILRWMQSGVRALLLQEAHPEEIAAALEAAHQGLAVASQEILDALLPPGMEVSGDDELPPGEPLTSREAEVLSMLANGAGNKEIASRLGISEHTVKFHVSSILGKLGAATRTEAVTRGYREGLIMI